MAVVGVLTLGPDQFAGLGHLSLVGHHLRHLEGVSVGKAVNQAALPTPVAGPGRQLGRGTRAYREAC
jgi:hypothetical protein